MKLKTKSEPKDGSSKDMAGNETGAVHFPWEGSMAALNSGAFDAVGYPTGSERGPDQPGAQSPAPGVHPLGGEEAAARGDVLTNIGRVGGEIAGGGLPREPSPMPDPKSPDNPVRDEKKDMAPDRSGDSKSGDKAAVKL